MSLERMFVAVDGLNKASSASSVFGEPVEVGGRLLIPVAVVGKGFGMAFTTGVQEDVETPSDEDSASAGGGGGSRPVAVLEVGPEGTVVRPIIDETKTSVAAIAMVAWVVFWIGATIRSVLSRG